MITAEQADKRRLDKMDSPQRIKWLREQATGSNLMNELATYHHMSLPTGIMGDEIVPKPFAEEVFTGIGYPRGLNPDEVNAAFVAVWSVALELAKTVEAKLRAAADRHMKATRGDVDGLLAAITKAQESLWERRSPWPYISPRQLDVIAKRLSPAPRPGKTRRKPLNLSVRAPMT